MIKNILAVLTGNFISEAFLLLAIYILILMIKKHNFSKRLINLHDNTHFNTYGAYELSKCIVEGIRSNKLGISKFLVDDMPIFDPSHPDAVETFNWPQSPRTSVVKPDGN